MIEGEPRRLGMWRRDLGSTGVVGMALAVAIVAVSATLIVPAFVAEAGGVFYHADIRQKLRGEAAQSMAAFEAEQQLREQMLETLDAQIRRQISIAPQNPVVITLFRLRNEVAQAKRAATPPIAVVPFYLNQQMLLWPATITCLAWIAVLMPPARDLTFWKTLRHKGTVLIGTGTYIFYEWPLWVRNLVLSNEGRVVYAYPNVDINPPSFAMQELIIFGFSLLLAVIWRQWSMYLLRVRQNDPADSSVRDHVAVLTDPDAATSFREVFSRWVSCSGLLALAFIGLTAFYWDLVGRYDDQRYLISAILVHVLWGLTWIVLSMPLLNEWRVWDISRTYALQQLALLSDSEESTRRAVMVKDIQPVSGTAFILANAASAISFVLPIVQAFFR